MTALTLRDPRSMVPDGLFCAMVNIVRMQLTMCNRSKEKGLVLARWATRAIPRHYRLPTASRSLSFLHFSSQCPSGLRCCVTERFSMSSN